MIRPLVIQALVNHADGLFLDDGSQVAQVFRSDVAEQGAYTRLFQQAPAMAAFIQRIVNDWSRLERNPEAEINGGDSVEWLVGIWKDARAIVGPPSDLDDADLHAPESEFRVRDTNAEVNPYVTPAGEAMAEVSAAEGWGIFETSRSEESEQSIVDGQPYGYRPFELQRDDEANTFPTDQEAWTHVVCRALAGSAPHQYALDFLQEHAFNEYAAIMRHSGREPQ